MSKILIIKKNGGFNILKIFTNSGHFYLWILAKDLAKALTSLKFYAVYAC